jgi:hypothetical protein
VVGRFCFGVWHLEGGGWDGDRAWGGLEGWGDEFVVRRVVFSHWHG